MSAELSKAGHGRHLHNWLSLAGAILAISAVFAFLFLFAIDLFAHHGNPYMGILAYVVAPGFFFLGLILVALGGWIHRRHDRQKEDGVRSHLLSIDLLKPRDRKMLVAFVCAALVFLLVTALGSYQTYHYTESVHFCGQACHVPMKPEFTAYLNSPHARVQCVECHVGSGATAYVKSKINGVHQLYGVIAGNYHRPINTPVKNLRPAQETCEQCHWPARYVGTLDRTYLHFLADETNTAFSVRLQLKVGGGDSSRGPRGGIHWHMSLANKVEYIATDPHRQIIPWVRVTDASGTVTEYRTADFKDEPASHTIRTMDCLDCHNRPAHQFQPPATAVDLAIALGKIDSGLPWIKSNSIAALIRSYKNEPEALETIATSLRASYPSSPKLDSSVATVQDIYRRNFFPEMKADWRVYPDNIGHKDWPGCFRCHDGLHKAASGKTMIPASDCNSCHTILAQGSGPDLEKLSPKGHNFLHVDSEYSDFSCANCHGGAFIK